MNMTFFKSNDTKSILAEAFWRMTIERHADEAKLILGIHVPCIRSTTYTDSERSKALAEFLVDFAEAFDHQAVLQRAAQYGVEDSTAHG